MRPHQLRLTFENSYPAITAGSQTSYPSARLRSASTLDVSSFNDKARYSRTESPQMFGCLMVLRKEPAWFRRSNDRNIFLVEKIHWFTVSSPNIGVLEGPPPYRSESIRPNCKCYAPKKSQLPSGQTWQLNMPHN